MYYILLYTIYPYTSPYTSYRHGPLYTNSIGKRNVIFAAHKVPNYSGPEFRLRKNVSFGMVLTPGFHLILIITLTSTKYRSKATFEQSCIT